MSHHTYRQSRKCGSRSERANGRNRLTCVAGDHGFLNERANSRSQPIRVAGVHSSRDATNDLNRSMSIAGDRSSRSASPNANPSPSVSQNFLTSSTTIWRLVRLANLGPEDHVVEIGSGKGHLTKILAKVCGYVTAVEIDPAMYEKTKAKLAGVQNLTLVNRDFLKWPLPAGDYKVFSNIPFCITTAIIRRLTESGNQPKEAWLMMEKAAALRFAGLPRESLRSLLLKPGFDANIVGNVRRDEFHPMPSVDAAVFHLKKKPSPDVPESQRRAYERFVTDGLNNPPGLLRRVFTKKQLSVALRNAGVRDGHVSGEMLYVQWLCLFRAARFCASSGRRS